MPTPSAPTTGMGTSVRNYQTTNVAVNYNRTISPNWLNELLVGVLREPNHSGTTADFVNWNSKLGTPNPFGVTGMAHHVRHGGFRQHYFGWDSDNNKQQHMTSETIEDNVTWTHSKHTIQFGFRGRKEQNNIEELQQAQGSHDWGRNVAYTTDWFDRQPSAHATDTGSGFAELLLGLPNYLSNQYNRGFFYFRQTHDGPVHQRQGQGQPPPDLNLGLRWDYFTPYTEARNRIVLPYAADSQFAVMTPGNLNINQLGAPASDIAAWTAIGLTYATADSQGYPSDLFAQVHHDFGPRLGVAYQLNHNTVIRGSYGIYYVPEPLNLLLQSARSTPPLNLRYQNQRLPERQRSGRQHREHRGEQRRITGCIHIALSARLHRLHAPRHREYQRGRAGAHSRATVRPRGMPRTGTIPAIRPGISPSSTNSPRTRDCA